MMYARSLLARDDTLFGVCAAIGEDFGFSPTLLRVLFAVAVFWSPEVTLGAYAAAGMAVAVSRWFVPEPVSIDVEEAGPAGSGQGNLQDQAQAWEELALAA